ncbi:hypothetical protein JYT79_02190 [Cardiobacterium sp. AH-315-I02]|nr:hypothetical protein [Cardiobacterium sp. AH-315-I02]
MLKHFSHPHAKQIFNILMMLKISIVSLIGTKTTNQQMQVKSVFGNLVSTIPVVSILFISPLFISTNVFSAAGDSINATATINYLVGGVSAISNASAEFTEDRRINFVVTEANGGSAIPVISDMTNAVMQFSITNMGNDTLDFLVTAVNTSANPFATPVDNFDPLPGTIQVFVENGVTPGYQATEDTAVFVDELALNTTRFVYVIADMPTQVPDDVSAIALIAQIAEGGESGIEGAAINADDNAHHSPAGVFSNGSIVMPAGVSTTTPDSPASMETVFNDPAGLNPEDVSTDLKQDIVGNGQHTTTGSYQLMSPVNIVKTVTVIDTLGGTDPHPGATLRYQLVVGVTGNTAVDNLVVSDVIPANTTYTDDSIKLNAVSQTDAIDAPVDYSHAIDILNKPVVSIEVDLSLGGSVAVTPGSTNIIIFEVTID